MLICPSTVACLLSAISRMLAMLEKQEFALTGLNDKLIRVCAEARNS
jgi:hypothetical protein